MTVEARPFHPSDLLNIQAQAAQAAAILSITPEECERVANSGPAFTLLVGDKLLGAGGIAPKWDGSAVAWTLIGRTAGAHFLSITRFARHVLHAAPYERIECHVDDQFGQGHRWAQMLGFEPEGLMRKFRNGRGFYLYAMVR